MMHEYLVRAKRRWFWKRTVGVSRCPSGSFCRKGLLMYIFCVAFPGVVLGSIIPAFEHPPELKHVFVFSCGIREYGNSVREVNVLVCTTLSSVD